MKINFSDALAPAQQKELARWWIFTLMFTGITLGIISTLVIPKAITFYHLAQEHAAWEQKMRPLQNVLEKEKPLKKEELELSTHVAKLTKYTIAPQPVAEAFSCVAHHMSTAQTRLESLIIDKKSFEVCCDCAHSKQTLKLIELLTKEKLFEKVSLVSLTTKKNTQETMLLVTIKGALKKL
jgi:hypothetical protein